MTADEFARASKAFAETAAAINVGFQELSRRLADAAKRMRPAMIKALRFRIASDEARLRELKPWQILEAIELRSDLREFRKLLADLEAE